MRRALATAGTLIVLLLGASAPAQDRKKDGKDDVVGIRWEFTATNGSETEEGLFRVYNHEIFRGARKVGEVKPSSPTESTLIITGMRRLNGTTTIRKVSRMPPVWRGELMHKNGSHWRIKITVHDA